MLIPAGTLSRYALPAIFFGALAAGQLLRFEPFSGSSGALTGLDAALAIMVFTLLGGVLRRRNGRDFLRHTWKHPVWKWSLLFMGWAIITSLINLHSYSITQNVMATAYLVRLLFAFVAAWLLSYLATDETRRTYLKSFTAASTALVVLGFLQFIFVNDFRFMVKNGWDPHIGRLLSTFFDPNQFGIFLVLVMGFALARYFETNREAKGAGRRWLALFGVSWLALFLAYSRSAWLAGIIAITGLAWRYRRLAAVGLLVVFVVVLLIPNRLAQRFADSEGLVQKNNYSDNLEDYQCADPTICDPSGSARVITIRQAARLIETSPILGVGYNAYAPALKNRDLLVPNQQQARGSQGSDSSLLNVWATTGIVGLLLFGRFLVAAAVALRRRFYQSSRTAWTAYGLFWFTIAWVVVSSFNNALLYLPLLAPWLVLLAVIIPGGSAKVRRGVSESAGRPKNRSSRARRPHVKPSQ